MKNSIELNIQSKWSISEWENVANGEATILFPKEIEEAVEENRRSLENRIKQGDILYGVKHRIWLFVHNRGLKF